MTDPTDPVSEERFRELAKRVDRAERRLYTLEQQADETHYEQRFANRVATLCHIDPDDVAVYTKNSPWPRATVRVPLSVVNRIAGDIDGDNAYAWKLLGVEPGLPPEVPVTDVCHIRESTDSSQPVHVEIRQRSAELDV